MAPRRALARRAKRLVGYWRSETRTLRQGLVALTLSTAAGFVAGLILAHLTDTLATLPGLLILIPAAVGMKGTIFGAIGARLGTASAAGLLTIDLRPGGVLRRNVQVAILTRGRRDHRAAVDLDLGPADDLGDRGGARFGPDPRDHDRAVRRLDEARLGPRLRLDADGHRPR
jgi:hypothetical protein